MAQPLVSIGMSVFNEAATLEAALRSMLNQTYAYWELIVVDDGSSDATSDIITRFDDSRIVRIADGRNLGLAERLNQTVSMAKGKYFARMDADDVSFPERLERQVAYLEAHPEVDLLGTGAIAIDEKSALIGKFRVVPTHGEICANPWNGINLPHPTWMGKSAWFRAHPYDVSMRLAQDQLLLIAAYPVSRYACLVDTLLAYRVERSSLKRIFRKRAYFAVALLKLATARGSWLQGGFAAAKQAVKAAAELWLRLSSAQEFLDRRRFAEVDQQDRESWDALRAALDIPS